MKKRVRENISAYLDGESADAQSIARVIAQSPEAAREHAALAELSARLRSLEAPEIHPAFAARVVATIEEQGVVRRFSWRLPLGAAAAAMLAAVLLFPSTEPRSTGRPAAAQIPVASPAQSEEVMLAELERRVTQDADVQHFVASRFENAPQPSQLYTERLIAAAAGPRGGAAAGALAHGMDYRDAVQRMNDAKADALKALLSVSMQEALEG